MNRIVARALCALCFLALAPPVLADPGGFHVRGGLVTSTFVIFGDSSGFADLAGSGDVGFAVGGGGMLPLGDRSALQIEAMYVNKGGRLVVDSSFLSVGLTVGYVEFPVTFRYEFPTGNVRPYALAGLSLGVKLHSSSSDTLILDLLDIGAADDLLRSTVGNAVLGAGLAFDNSRWSFEIRANIGLTDAFESRIEGSPVEPWKTKLNAFHFLVGYGF